MMSKRAATPAIELLQIKVILLPSLFIAHQATKFPGICMAPETVKFMNIFPPTCPIYWDIPNNPIPQTIQLKKIDSDFILMLGVRNRSKNDAL